MADAVPVGAAMAADAAGRWPDAAVLAAHRSGDSRAFAHLVDRYGALLWKTVRELVDTDEAALEVQQEVLLRAHRAAARFRFGSAAGTWLAAIARNCVVDRRRRLAARPELPVGRDRDCPAGGPSQATIMVVRDAVRRLPEQQRVVVEHVDFAGYGVKEAAETLGLSPGTVKSRRARARRRLRAELAEAMGMVA